MRHGGAHATGRRDGAVTPRQRAARLSRRSFTVVALCALIVIAVAWALMSTQSSTPAATNSSDSTTSTAGVATCPLPTLPPEVADTVRRIHSNGPFPFPRNDGVVFGNREGHLPDRAKGYYHEYTVINPGARNRSTRRVITGGAPVTDPRQCFYTADHYDSFCLVTGAGGPS
ncbi:MAG: ribonuclease [Mycobacterium sp.]|jgi:ribonuclease T1|nr:ribonuclease [Mycobacterium sp.]MDT5311730.1 ribonuclease [Mycobacterium sp.]